MLSEKLQIQSQKPVIHKLQKGYACANNSICLCKQKYMPVQKNQTNKKTNRVNLNWTKLVWIRLACRKMHRPNLRKCHISEKARVKFHIQVSDSLVCSVQKWPSQTHTLIWIRLLASICGSTQEVVSSHANHDLCWHVQTHCTRWRIQVPCESVKRI